MLGRDHAKLDVREITKAFDKFSDGGLELLGKGFIIEKHVWILKPGK